MLSLFEIEGNVVEYLDLIIGKSVHMASLLLSVLFCVFICFIFNYQNKCLVHIFSNFFIPKR